MQLISSKVKWNQAEREQSNVKERLFVKGKIQVYLAGPDFPHIDTKWIDELHDRLNQEGFVSRRPIQENGLFTGNETDEQRQEIFDNDVRLLEETSMLIAVLLNDDPGTYVEIGWMSKAGKPVIIFDPHQEATNLFLVKSADAIAYTINEVIEHAKRLSDRMESEKTQIKE
nr:nucleoside 2-deoxyribosyltransferase [Planomicrobium sp. YIM 101495]